MSLTEKRKHAPRKPIDPVHKPNRIIIFGMVLVALVALGLFGIVELMREGTFDNQRLCDAVKNAAAALLVGGILSLIFEFVLQRQASKATEQALQETFTPVTELLDTQHNILQKMLVKAQETMDLSHVMTVAQHVGIINIFKDRKELFDRELKTRLQQDDLKRIFMVGVSLRDFFAGDAPLYDVTTALNERIKHQKKHKEKALKIQAVIMRGDCEDADVRIEVEEGDEFKAAGKKSGGNWREKSRLWSDYKRVTDAWSLHFDQIELFEFDHLPTAWVVLIESLIQGKGDLYIEQYHYGRLSQSKIGIGEFYSCLGGRYPVFKFGEGTVYSIFRNHVVTLMNNSQESCKSTDSNADPR